jgi:hypothetical protein
VLAKETGQDLICSTPYIDYIHGTFVLTRPVLLRADGHPGRGSCWPRRLRSDLILHVRVYPYVAAQGSPHLLPVDNLNALDRASTTLDGQLRVCALQGHGCDPWRVRRVKGVCSWSWLGRVPASIHTDLTVLCTKLSTILEMAGYC